MEESQTDALAVKGGDRVQVHVPDLYPQLRESLTRGTHTLEERLLGIDVNVDGAEIEAQDVVARAREAYDLAAKAAAEESGPLTRAVDLLVGRWQPLKRAFEELRQAGKAKAMAALQARRGREAKARQAAEEALQKARRDEEAEAARVAAGEAPKEGPRPALAALRASREAVDSLPPAGAPLGVVSESGSLKPRTTWTFEVQRLQEVPREWLKVDSDKVQAAIAGENGLREIPGLRIFPHTTLVDRRPSKRGRSLET